MAWRDRIAGLLTPSNEDSVAGVAKELSAESAYLSSLKQQTLDTVRQNAIRENRDPNLTDYFRAALQVPELADPRVMADLSGQSLDGFTIRRADLHPTPDERRQLQDALSVSNDQRNADAGIRAMRNFIDADGNNQVEVKEIDTFYAAIEASMKFHGTQFTNVTFQPATTLEIFNNDVARGAQFGNITLNGLEPGETLHIGSGRNAGGEYKQERYDTIHVVGANGATIHINNGVIVDNLEMDHGQTKLVVAGGAQVNFLDVHQENISLQVEKNGILFRPSFREAVFTPASSFAGADIRGDQFDGKFNGFDHSHLNGISFEGARLSGIDFKHSDITGAKFAGATLSNTSFKDMNLSVADFGNVKSVHNVSVERNGQTTVLNSVEELERYVEAERGQIARETRLNEQLSSLNLGTIQQMNAIGGTELRQTPTAALQQGPAPLPAPSATEPVRAVSGGDSPAQETAAQTIARLGGALSDNFGQPVVNADLNDVRTQDHNTADARVALAAALEIKAREAMEGYTRIPGGNS